MNLWNNLLRENPWKNLYNIPEELPQEFYGEIFESVFVGTAGEIIERASPEKLLKEALKKFLILFFS